MKKSNYILILLSIIIILLIVLYNIKTNRKETFYGITEEISVTEIDGITKLANEGSTEELTGVYNLSNDNSSVQKIYKLTNDITITNLSNYFKFTG